MDCKIHMGKLTKIIKINILAIISLPILLIAIALKLIATIFGKLVFILSIAGIFVLVAFIFEIIKDWNNIFHSLFITIAVLLAGGIIISIIVFSHSFIFAIGKILSHGTTMIFEILYRFYVTLFDTCRAEHKFISNGGKVFSGIVCIFFTILKAVNKLLIFCTSFAVFLAAGGSALLVFGSLLGINKMIQKEFSLSAIEYLKSLSAIDKVYGITLYAVLIVGAIAILLMIGVEWRYWSMEMIMATSGDFSSYAEILKQNEPYGGSQIEYKDDIDNVMLDKCSHYNSKLNEHVAEYDEFIDEVKEIIIQCGNVRLKTDFNDYLALLEDITTQLFTYGGTIAVDIFEKFIPKIEQLEKQKESINIRVQMLSEEMKGQSQKLDEGMEGKPVFFLGCDTNQKLEKRYRDLCKTYHPDGGTGDENTFKLMRNEYEKLKAKLDMH